MRRSICLLILATELVVIASWYSSLRIETGFDSLQYQRMASAIARTGAAAWAANPLAYIGVLPGSDNSGVPFLAASFSLLSGLPVPATVLVYDVAILVVFGLGIFLLVNKLTTRAATGLLSILMGCLAYGLFSATSWTLDERSFNVALEPVLLLLIIPGGARVLARNSAARYLIAGLVGFTMLVAHLSLLLLLPFIVLTPLIYEVVYRQFALRRHRRTTLLYFGAIGASPLALLFVLDALGILNSYGLQYQLESSALFTGTSPLFFLLNSLVFLGTRIGIVNIGGLVLGLAYLISRRHLVPRDIVLGGYLLAGLLGLPIVLYSKDLLMPLCVLVGAVGIGAVTGSKSARRRTVALALTAALVLTGSLAFDQWNLARTSRSADTTYWTLPGVTPEAESGALWMTTIGTQSACAYGNNPAMLQQVAFGPTISVCDGIPVDTLINGGSPGYNMGGNFRVVFVGFAGPNPKDWFSSPTLDRVAADFSNLPALTYDAGRNLLRSYNVSFLVIDLRKPSQIPLFGFQGTYTSEFFSELWVAAYPVYRGPNFALFDIR